MLAQPGIKGIIPEGTAPAKPPKAGPPTVTLLQRGPDARRTRGVGEVAERTGLLQVRRRAPAILLPEPAQRNFVYRAAFSRP